VGVVRWGNLRYGREISIRGETMAPSFVTRTLLGKKVKHIWRFKNAYASSPNSPNKEGEGVI